MDSFIRAEDFQIPSFLADLNAPLANSTLLANPLQIDLEPSAADPTDTIRIVRGRTLNSKNLLYCGFRYVKDGKPSTITGRQPWKCVRMKMKYKGRLHTNNEQLVEVRNQHNHGPDLADCEVRATLSTIKDTSTRTSNHLIYCSITVLSEQFK